MFSKLCLFFNGNILLYTSYLTSFNIQIRFCYLLIALIALILLHNLMIFFNKLLWNLQTIDTSNVYLHYWRAGLSKLKKFNVLFFRWFLWVQLINCLIFAIVFKIILVLILKSILNYSCQWVEITKIQKIPFSFWSKNKYKTTGVFW